YRAVAVASLRAGVALDDPAALATLLSRICIEMPPRHVRLNGEDVSLVIRTSEVSQAASKVASVRVVREFLVGLQRTIAAGRGMVCEGRDQGTVVFPNADCKFFLQANREERARRRLAEIHDRGSHHVTFEEVLAQQEERDRRDASRDLAPMVAAPDAKIIDTSDMTPDEVLDQLEREIRRCLPV